MVVQKERIIRDAASGDLYKLANLIHFDSYIHRHLDYRSPLEWIGCSPYPIIEENNQITAALACPPDPEHIAWIRLFAAAYSVDLNQVWDALWQKAQASLSENPVVHRVAAIPLYGWFSKLLLQADFSFSHNILMLSWEHTGMPAKPTASTVRVRPMTLDDLEWVSKLDQSAFPPLWQISTDYIELAFRQAAIATVAEQDNAMVGFQISTATSVGGHLARLAVEPSRQGTGIGYSLLYDLLGQFKRRGAQTITVNTQEYNQASLKLYKRAGFVPTGEVYPVLELTLGEI